MRRQPAAHTGAGEFRIQGLEHLFKTRPDERPVREHVLCERVGITQKTHVAQLVHLVGPDGLETQVLFVRVQVIRAGGHETDAGTGESDFRGGAKLEHTIQRALTFAGRA